MGYLAGESTVRPDWALVARQVREATAGWDDRAAVERLEGKGARFVRGWARVVGERRAVVEDRQFEARRALVLATGAVPWEPPVSGLADASHGTNRQAVAAEDVPSSLRVLGGGAIGLELGQVLARLGVQVRVVEVAERRLVAEEPESSALVAEVLAADPEIGAVGLTQAGAESRGARVRTGRSEIASSSRVWIHDGGNDGFIKLIEDVDRGVLVGRPRRGRVEGRCSVCLLWRSTRRCRPGSWAG